MFALIGFVLVVSMRAPIGDLETACKLIRASQEPSLGLRCQFEGHTETRDKNGTWVRIDFDGEYQSNVDGCTRSQTLYRSPLRPTTGMEWSFCDGKLVRRSHGQGREGEVATLPVNARMLRFPDSPEEVLGFGFFQRLPAEPPSAIGQFMDRGIVEVEGRASIEFHLEIGEASERFWLDLERGGLIVKYERWWKKQLAERIDRVELAQEKSKSGEASWRPVRWHKALFVGLCVPGSSNDLPGGTIVQDPSNVKPPRAWKAFREPITKTYVQIINSTVKYNRERGAKEGFAVNAVRGNVVRDLTKNSSPRVEGRRTADATDYPSLQAGLDLLEKDAKGERTFLAANYRDNTSWWWYGSIVLAAVAVGLLIHIRRRQ